MARWRDTKQGKAPKEKKKKSKQQKKDELYLPFASNIEKAKAFLTDTFMIMMPVMYIVIYLYFGDLKTVGEHKLLSWAIILGIVGVIVTLFYTLKGQTPGLKAYELKLVDIQTKQKPSFILSFLRYIFFTINFFSLGGLLYGLFRKDKRGIHDLLSGTAIVKDIKQ